MIEAHRLARDLDPLSGEESEEQILHALGRILAERFVQNPGVVGVEVEGELLLLAQAGKLFTRDAIDDVLDRLHIGGVIFPCGISHSAARDIFGEQSVVSADPFRRTVRATDRSGPKKKRSDDHSAQASR